MHKRMILASVSIQEGTPSSEFRFHPGTNVLWGQNAEDIVLTLAGIFGGMPPKNGKAEILWNTDASLFISITDGACGVGRTRTQGGSGAQLVKDFHKHRFLNLDKRRHILDGTQLPTGIFGASDLLQEKLGEVFAKEEDQPLFVINFLERLDEAVDLRPVFATMIATGRQVFVAVPHYYKIKALEELPYVTIIRTL